MQPPTPPTPGPSPPDWWKPIPPLRLIPRPPPDPSRDAAGRLARFVSFNLLGTATSLALGFGASVLLARLLGPSNRGVLAVMLSAATLGLALTAGGLPVSVVYFAAKRREAGPAILGNCVLHGIVLGAVLIPLALLFFRPLGQVLAGGHGGRTWALAAVVVPVTFLDWTTHSQLQGQLDFGRYNVLLVLQRLMYVLGVLILLGVLSLGVASALLATIAGSGVMIAGAALPILRVGRPRLDFRLMREMLHYGGRAQIGSVLQIANGRLDVIVLGLFRPTAQVGYYVVAQTIAELVVQLADTFQWSNMALVAQGEASDSGSSTSALAIRHLALVAGVAALANAGFGTVVILFAYGTAFHPAVLPMLVLLPGVWLMAIAVVAQGDLSGRGRPGLASSLTGGAAVVTVALDLALIPSFGVIGAAIASTCAYSALGVASVVALSRVSGIKLRVLCVPGRAELAVYTQFAKRLLTGRR
ncbi:MAG: oligosaccharide flippase family protein [Solirubrobacteraceae bacterium]